MPNRILSDDQFAAHTNTFNEYGYAGGTRNVHTGEEHPIGSPGYVVARPGHEKTVAGPSRPADVTSHRAALLADPAVSANPRATQGSWHVKPGKSAPAPNGQEVTYDAGEVVKGGNSPQRRAVSMGRQGAQRAIFDLKRGEDIKLPGGIMHDALHTDLKAVKKFKILP